jgi:hypothetical protein
MLNVALVLIFATSILGPVLTEAFALRLAAVEPAPNVSCGLSFARTGAPSRRSSRSTEKQPSADTERRVENSAPRTTPHASDQRAPHSGFRNLLGPVACPGKTRQWVNWLLRFSVALCGLTAAGRPVMVAGRPPGNGRIRKRFWVSPQLTQKWLRSVGVNNIAKKCSNTRQHVKRAEIGWRLASPAGGTSAVFMELVRCHFLVNF